MEKEAEKEMKEEKETGDKKGVGGSRRKNSNSIKKRGFSIIGDEEEE